VAGCLPAAGAEAQQSVAPQLTPPQSQTIPPPGFRLSARQAIAIAEGTAAARRARRDFPSVSPVAYVVGPGSWEVDFEGRRTAVAEVDLDGVTGRVLKTWSGWQASSYPARGHFGKLADSPWVWLPLCVLFVAPFFDFRRPLRMLHLDLLVLLGFGVSHLFYTQGKILASVPLVYPVLAYLLARMLWLGFRPRSRRERLVPHARTALLAIGLAVLVAFRIFVNVAAHNVPDIGYAGVVGADRIEHKQPLYVDNAAHGDTYGPVNYLTYLPFELVFPTHGVWDDVPAAHATTIFLDLLCIAALLLLGGRMRAGPEGRRLGLALAFAWAAYPYTMYVLAGQGNDALVAAPLLLALLAFGKPAARGLMVGLGAAAKFVPLAAAPLLASPDGSRRARPVIHYGVALTAAVAVPILLYLPPGGLHVFWNTTLGYQLGRVSPLSAWTIYPSLDWLRPVAIAGTALLAGATAFVPRRRTLPQVAALMAAIMIAVELTARHWFYFYVVWFAPFVLVALFAAYRTESGRGDAGELDEMTLLVPGRERLPL
jgi:hypothetical protein